MNIYIHDLDPVAFTLGIPIRWYSLSYLGAYLLAIWVYPHYLKMYYTFNTKQYQDFITSGVLFGLIGGRVGHVLGYEWSRFIIDPLMLFAVWQGGMSIHGGLLGSFIYILHRCKYKIREFLILCDMMCVCTTSGIFLGRIANFVNAEIIGIPTQQKWGVIFPQYDFLPRHPVQLYESIFEGLFITVIIFYLHRRTESSKAPGTITIVSFVLYALARIVCEMWRVPDGLVNFKVIELSLGQLYSIPLLILAACIAYSQFMQNHYKRSDEPHIQKTKLSTILE